MRADKHITFMRMALLLAERSTCPRASVGAILLDSDGVIRGAGYNGAPRGMEHCTGDCTFEGHCARSIHAEENAITTSRPADIRGGTLYCTHYPCHLCQLKIVQAGIGRVYYHHPYGRSDAPKWLEAEGIPCRRIDIKEERT